MEDITKQQRHKAPHEILAVGVGVKPPYDYNSNVIGSTGGYTKVTAAVRENDLYYAWVFCCFLFHFYKIYYIQIEIIQNSFGGNVLHWGKTR